MRRIFWLLLLCGAVCAAQTSTGGGQSGTGGGGGGGITSINADTTPSQTLVSGTGISISDGGGGLHTVTNTGVTSAPGSLHDLICTGGSSNFVACATGAAYYSSGILTVPQIAVSGTTPAAVSWVAGTGNIPALPANSAGFAAPTTGGTAFLIKWPGTGAVGVWQSAACGTGDNVNECALSFSTALANGTTATTQTAGDNTNDVATDAFVTTATAGVAPIYDTAQTGVSMLASPTTGTITTICSSGVCTMAGTGLTTGTYRLQMEVIQTTPGSTGTCTTGTIVVQYCYKESDDSVTISCTSSPAKLLFTPLGTPAFSTNVAMAAGGNGVSNIFYSAPAIFRAATGVAIQYVLDQTVTSNCTTPPVFTVRPILYYLGF